MIGGCDTCVHKNETCVYDPRRGCNAYKEARKSQQSEKEGVNLFKGNCEYCEGAKALVIGKTDDKGIAISSKKLIAYGYDVHGYSSNGLSVKIKFCPMCGRKF